MPATSKHESSAPRVQSRERDADNILAPRPQLPEFDIGDELDDDLETDARDSGLFDLDDADRYFSG